MKKIKNSIILIIYTMIIGILSGLIIWSFLKVMNLGIDFLWFYLPNKINIKYYTIIICLIGGIIIGLWKWKFGESPEELEEVIKKVKKNKRYSYNNIFSSIGSALFPLLIGSSVGPEAGLTGIIASLCTWVGDKLKHMFKEIQELTSIGITATLGTIFKSPMFGFIEPLEGEEETKLPKTSKIILYFTAILSSFGIFMLLNRLVGQEMGMPTVGIASFKELNFFHIIILTIIGIMLGYIYFISHKITKVVFKPLGNNILIKCIIGGLILGLIGTILPLTMFSGEEQIITIVETGRNIGIVVLILTSIIKVLLTNICIESGLKGGHFFPMIFSGISLGYAMSIILNMDPVISMAIVTSSFLANIMKKPLAVVLLLMIVFPSNLIPIMLTTSIIACLFKTPKILENK